MRLILVAAAFLAPTAVFAAPLSLVCRGEARYVEDESTTGSTTGADGYPKTATYDSARNVRSPERFRFEIDEAGSGRVKPPRVQIPLLKSGGRDGWWTLASVAVTDTEIRAQYAFNPFNKPRVQIDRRTGEVEIVGFRFTFAGMCETAPDETAPRKF